MIPVNIRKVRVAAFSVEVSNSLEYASSVFFSGEGEVTHITGSNNQDGTQNVTYNVKSKVAMVQKADSEVGEKKDITQTYTLKEKSRSKALRNRCFIEAQRIGESAEGLYNSCMDAAEEYLAEHVFQITQPKEK